MTASCAWGPPAADAPAPLQGEVGLHRARGPASRCPRSVCGPRHFQPAARLLDGGQVVAVGLGAGRQTVAVGHEHAVAELPFEAGRDVSFRRGDRAADGAVPVRDTQQAGSRIQVLQDGVRPRGQHFLVRPPGRMLRRREAHGAQLAEGAEGHAGDEQRMRPFGRRGGEQPRVPGTAGGVEEPERSLQARPHLGEDVAQRMLGARGTGSRSRSGHGVYRGTAWAEVVHLAAGPRARREQQVVASRPRRGKIHVETGSCRQDIRPAIAARVHGGAGFRVAVRPVPCAAT